MIFANTKFRLVLVMLGLALVLPSTVYAAGIKIACAPVHVDLRKQTTRLPTFDWNFRMKFPEDIKSTLSSSDIKKAQRCWNTKATLKNQILTFKVPRIENVAPRNTRSLMRGTVCILGVGYIVGSVKNGSKTISYIDVVPNSTVQVTKNAKGCLPL